MDLGQRRGGVYYIFGPSRLRYRPSLGEGGWCDRAGVNGDGELVVACTVLHKRVEASDALGFDDLNALLADLQPLNWEMQNLVDVQ